MTIHLFLLTHSRRQEHVISTTIGDRLHGLRFFLGFPCILSLSFSSRRRAFGVTELWRSHVSGCAYICSDSVESIDLSESLLFQFVVESSATSCDVVPRLLKQLSFVCFSVLAPKPRAEGSSPSAPAKTKPSEHGWFFVFAEM